jgi:hypothetical protein
MMTFVLHDSIVSRLMIGGLGGLLPPHAELSPRLFRCEAYKYIRSFVHTKTQSECTSLSRVQEGKSARP